MRINFLCLSLFIFTSFLLISCDDSNNNFGNDAGALTEHDFLNDEGAFAVPEDGVVLTHLEHPDADHEADTGEQGMDIIPIKYIEDSNHTYCWEDDNEDASHFMTLNDLDGNELLRVDANGDCVTEFVEAGEYEIHIHHDGNSEEVFPVFLRPDNSEDEEAEQVSQTSEQNLQTLISTNSCPGCDLRGAVIGYTQVGGQIVTNVFQFSNLSGADLREADLRAGFYDSVDFTNASLVDALVVADSDVPPAFFFGGDFSAAAWVNGNACQEGSIGICHEAKFAFITSFTMDGNVKRAANNNFRDECGNLDSGLDAGDCLCSGLAEEAGLGSNYRAWLGTDEGSPSTRFTQSTIPYIRTDGKKVANNFNDLTDGSISNPIKYSEDREEVFVLSSSHQNDVRVWTAVRQMGQTKTGDNCDGWTTRNPDFEGQVGTMSTTGNSWTDFSSTDNCSFTDFARIYCFQQ